MKRARLRSTGWREDLVIEDADDPPAPTGHRVLVHVQACGVCHRDCIDRTGRFKFMRTPITPGHEAVGRVSAVGPDVTAWRVGDRVATLHRDHCGRCDACRRGHTSLCTMAASVLGLLIDGGYATHLVVPEFGLYRADEHMPAAAAAILHCTYGTAYRGLTGSCAVTPGQRVLITGANGGVGAAAVQVARALGAQAIAVVRDGAAESFVRELGADTVIVDPGDGFHKKLSARVDAVLDCVGQPTFNASVRALRPGSRMVVLGNVTEERAELNLGYLILQSIEIAGSRGADAHDMSELLNLYQAAPWTIPIGHELPLDEADRAQRMVAAGGLRGRTVLRMAT